MINKWKTSSSALNVEADRSLETRPAVKSSAMTVDWCWKTTSSTKVPSGVSFLLSKATSVLVPVHR